jgi:CHAD domain-containing protein
MAYRFRKSESLPHAIRRVYTEEIDWAVGQLARAKDRERAVHEARKSLKKIRGLLGLIAKPLGRVYKTEDRYFRNIGQQLSKLRDSAVLLETFDALVGRHPELDSVALVNMRCNLLRWKREAAAEKQVSAEVWQALAAARAKAVIWPLDRLLQFPAVLVDLTAVYRAGRKAYRKALREQTAESFHDFRKQVKKHWYHLRLFEGHLSSEMKKRVKELRTLETVLGDEHNLAVLRERIAADVETTGDRHEIRAFLAVLEDEGKQLRELAMKSGEELYAARPRIYAETLATLWPNIPKRPAAAAPFRKTAVA